MIEEDNYFKFLLFGSSSIIILSGLIILTGMFACWFSENSNVIKMGLQISYFEVGKMSIGAGVASLVLIGPVWLLSLIYYITKNFKFLKDG